MKAVYLTEFVAKFVNGRYPGRKKRGHPIQLGVRVRHIPTRRLDWERTVYCGPGRVDRSAGSLSVLVVVDFDIRWNCGKNAWEMQ
jgi:hypothetical protein